MKPRCVLFDLDCTLTDRSATLARYAPVFADHFRGRLLDPDPAEVLARYAEVDELGYGSRTACWNHLLRTLRWREPPAIEEMDRMWKEQGPLCSIAAAEATSVLDALRDRGYTLGIITNGPVFTQERKVETLGLRRWMKSVVVSEAAGIDKPAAAIFHQACRGLEVTPAETWYVGDHPLNDVIGARGAGLTEVWVRLDREWAREEPAPARQIERLSELLEML